MNYYNDDMVDGATADGTNAADSEQTKQPDNQAAKNAAQDVANEAFERTKEILSKLVDEAKSTAQQFRQQAVASADDGRVQLASQIGSIAEALHRGGQQLRDDSLEDLAQGSDWLAEQVSQVQAYLNEQNAEGLFGDARQAIKKRPAFFLGGLFITSALAVVITQTSGDKKKTATMSSSPSEDVGQGKNDTGRAATQYEAAKEARAERNPPIIVTRENS